MASPTLHQFEINGQRIPVKIYRERRKNVRASIGRKTAILRLPKHLHKSEEQEKIKWFYHWLEKQMSRYTHLFELYENRSYEDGQTLVVGKKQYQLAFRYENRKTVSAKLTAGTILIKLSKEVSEAAIQEKLPQLLSRVVAQDFQAEIERRVDDINDRHFHQDINEVKLKYVHSRWGSCSSKGNINLSTRLLFAPDDVIDYVIIHELAHLIEFNHSKKFWSIIAQIMPDYKEKEKWLEVNGGKCRF